MNMLTSPDFWSMVSSGISIILGILAIVLAIWFFVLSKKTETRVTESLTKIETQATMLEQITGKQLDRLTKFVTQPQQSASDKALSELIPLIKDLPTNLLKIPEKGQVPDVENLQQQIAIAYGALYFYIAQTNFWSQLNLPRAETFDPNMSLQSEAKSVVDLSAQDFSVVANYISTTNSEQRLKGTSVEQLLLRTKDFWKNFVRNSSDVFIMRAKQTDKNG